MKHAFQNLGLALLSLIFIPTQLLGQLYEVSLDEKIEKSTLIVEGKVVESQCYRADNGNIYTANKVQLVSLLKGDYRENYLTVTTWGGEMDGELQTWTHLLTFDIGDYGLFFLQPTRVPTIKTTDYPTSFDVYSGVQGFVAFTRNEAKALVGYEPFHTYGDIPNDIYGHIARKTGHERVPTSAESDEIRNGVRYHFTNIGFDGTSVTFDIYVNSLFGTKKLHTSGVQLGYNPAFFGSNIATSGNLLMQDAGISLSSTYDLTQSNVTSSKVKIELAPVGSLAGLTEIGTTEQLLAKGKITIQNILADPGIVYDIAEMQSMSKFYESGTAQVFDTVIVEGSWRPGEFCKPVISSFTPDKLAAGVGDILTIQGNCFGPYIEGFAFIQFTNAANGLDGTWSDPIVGEYLTWNDTLIRVKVHSVGAGGSVGGTINHYAGSGKFVVWNMDFLSDTSETALLVQYSAYNAWTGGTDIPPKSAIPSTLVGENDLDGMTFTVDPNLKNDTAAYNAFIRALNTWKCATRVNFNVDSAYPNTNGKICNVKFGDLPNGTSAVYGRVTNYDLGICKDLASGTYIKAYYEAFDLIFNDSTNFYKGISPIEIDTNQIDFQSVALHELGHCHLLHHVNQVSDVMYAKIDEEDVKRALNSDNVEGGNHLVEISGYTYPGSNCNTSPMLPADISGLGCSSGTTDKTSNSQKIILYPNPVSDILSIHIVGQRFGNEINKAKIVNVYGKILKEIEIPSTENPFSFPTDFLSSGMYLIQIEEGNQIVGTSKFVKI